MNAPTPANPGVNVEPRTLAWLGSVYSGCFISLAPSGEFAADAIKAAVYGVLQADHNWRSESHSVRIATVIEGVDALHIRIHYGAAERSEVRAWATGLAAALTEAGVSGTLARVLPQYPPGWVTNSALNNRTVSVLYAMRLPIDFSVTRRLASAHGLDLLEHHSLSGGSEFNLTVPYSSSLLASLPDLGTLVNLIGWREAGHAHAELEYSSFRAQGWTYVGDRREQTARARTALVELADVVHHAFAELMTVGHGWSATPYEGPDGLSSAVFGQLKDIWPYKVFDAHGLQILTRDHLD